MSKKQKRQVSSAPVSAASEAAAPARVVRPVRSTAVEEFKPDYSYVVTDLKKIGILAGSFIAVLVVVSFFLN